MFLRFAALAFGLIVAMAAAGATEAQDGPRIEIVPQLGHWTAVNSVAYSPDGKTALSGSDDHTARVWDLATGREIRKLEGHSGSVESVSFSPDGKTALSGSDDTTADSGPGHGPRDPQDRGAFRGGPLGRLFARWQDRAVGEC